jgi:hypothetical protein
MYGISVVFRLQRRALFRRQIRHRLIGNERLLGRLLCVLFHQLFTFPTR